MRFQFQKHPTIFFATVEVTLGCFQRERERDRERQTDRERERGRERNWSPGPDICIFGIADKGKKRGVNLSKKSCK